MRRRLGALAGLFLFSAGPLLGQPELVPGDRLVAVVDDDPIFFSDLERARVLGDRRSEDLDDRELLDQIIDRRLRLHEVDRYSEEPIAAAEIDASLARLEVEFGGPEALDRRLRGSGLDREDLRELTRQRLRVLLHIEDRLGARIFIDEAEMRSYYEGELRDEMDRRGLPLPPFSEVADGIRRVLRERALNRDIERWTQTLREAAEVVDLLDHRAPLPPRVWRLEAEEPD